MALVVLKLLQNSLLIFVLGTFFSKPSLAAAKISDDMSLPPVPYPSENQPTEAKRVLGKILFWDEQLSTDNSIACGTCHLPSANGADKRIGLEPGFDKIINTSDDILGSLGVVSRDALGQVQNHSVFKQNPQVTNRTAQAYFSGIWADTNFWDGRASSEFIDPKTKKIVISAGGALESQALGPLMSNVEMAKDGQTADEIITKLKQAKPLALATNLPADIQAVLSDGSDYNTLFTKAFGDQNISLKRIAFALATYERSLVSNQTPWDLAMAKQQKLPYLENLGWEFFQQSGCAQCHTPPLFTDNKFYNIGIQGINTDLGRKQLSLDSKDHGAMKVPSLRNTGLKLTYMHTGQFTSLEKVIDVYANVPFEDMATKMPNGEKYNFQFSEYQRKALIAFLTFSLTDERVKNETFPFDRPKLRNEISNTQSPQAIQNSAIGLNKKGLVEISWQQMQAELGFDVEIVRNDGRHYWAAQSPFEDIYTEFGESYEYQIFSRNGQLSLSEPAILNIKLASDKSIYWLLTALGLLLLTIVVYSKKMNKPN
ncbi:cytochrome-c peroxidase [Paraglaciecola sp. L3A3]|uniref:cytochrome-c peroxidase n=1 Tax=Paraglaciecola sp. L3A3 TaxID=2686358 RepID=UPI00131DF322|nr:cytochrome c peroxidase [Paraglaciecola sp. L3A3]